MTADVDICNMALSRLGARATIASLTDTTPEAVKLALHYPLARGMLLEQHDWSFARKQALLAQVVGNPVGWGAIYKVPSDCRVFRGIHNGIAWPSPPIVPFEVVNTTLGQIYGDRVVLTNAYPAVGVYTAQIVDLNQWTSSLLEVLALQLAAYAAFDITGNQQTGPALQKEVDTRMEMAWAKDREQMRHELCTEFEPDWLCIRDGSRR